MNLCCNSDVVLEEGDGSDIVQDAPLHSMDNFLEYLDPKIGKPEAHMKRLYLRIETSLVV
jgi:hypothetical protein